MEYKNKVQNYNKGKEGEEIAREYLLKKGFNLIESNYSNSLGEVDLIMSDKEWLVFVEVKLKISDKFGTPEEMIGKGKISQVRRVAELYLLTESPITKKYKKFRIDAVCIVENINKTINRIDHYENIY